MLRHSGLSDSFYSHPLQGSGIITEEEAEKPWVLDEVVEICAAVPLDYLFHPAP